MRRRSHSWLQSATSIMRAGKSSLNRKKKRKRGVRSPDRAEVVMLAFAPEIPREVQGIVYYYDPVSNQPGLDSERTMNDKSAGMCLRRCRFEMASGSADAIGSLTACGLERLDLEA